MIKNSLITIVALSASCLGSAFAGSYTYTDFFFYGKDINPTVTHINSSSSIIALQVDDNNVFIGPKLAFVPTYSFSNQLNITASYQGHSCALTFSSYDLQASTAHSTICCPGFDENVKIGAVSFSQDHPLSPADLQNDGSFSMPSDMSMHRFTNSCAS